VPEGTEGVPVNAVIAVLAEDGEDMAEVAKIDPATLAPAAAQSAPEAAEAQETPTPEAAPKQAAAAAAPTSVSAPSSAPAAPAPAAQPRGRVFASPLAKRLAKEHGIDLARIAGSGPRGRIVKRDVEAAIASGVTAAPAGAGMAAGMSVAEILALYPQGSYDLKPIDSMRRAIASRLTLSKQTVPHFYLTVECVIDRLLQARKALNAEAPTDEDGKPAWKLSVNDFVIRAWALALKKVPDANVTWTEAGMLHHHAVDVSVAVAIEGGLITPIIRAADALDLPAISATMKDLAARARARRLKPEEYQGGTTSISNLGMFGIDQFAAVINPPQATILAVGQGKERVVAEAGRPVVRTVMTATLSADHRAVDGAVAAQALTAFRRYIEEPALLLAGA
jgi:pyruvate dehydrogenase E2 component (dihydrolipoamide acetyltransferase)